MRRLRIGIDVGGTHTDSVILDQDNKVVSVAKVDTTRDVITGIRGALREVVSKTSNPDEIVAVMLGTTHCTNAIVERRNLAKVGSLRIGKKSTSGIPPLFSLPKDLIDSMQPVSVMVDGGHEYDGREIVELDEPKLHEASKYFTDQKVRSIAISSVFSPVNKSHEERAASIVASYLPNTPITLSSEIGSLGLIARENAALLNAALIDVASHTIESFEQAVKDTGISKAKLYLTQNDGTLMSTQYASKFPIKTISCGPTNSIRGAAFLTGITDGIVVDIGGTTTLVGAISKGFPRESGAAVDIGGVSTNFRMPDILAVGCGGGSIVRVTENSTEIQIGPDSVAFELTEKAMSWGGKCITTTDIAIANGFLTINDGKCDPSRVASLDKVFVQRAVEKISQIIEDAIDRMRLTASPIEVVLVGGGGVIIPQSRYGSFAGTARVRRPEMFQYANAIGAALGLVSGECDRIFSYESSNRDQVIKEAAKISTDNAIKAGAIPNTVKIVEIEEIPMTYVSSNAIRIRAKATGEIALVN
jgi:N-methylhydantoinase A/oxoprolinase/acetone carboxylase beta subunit